MIALTFDTDWCPEYMIGPILDALEGLRIKSTWFFTGPYSQIDRMRKRPDLYELGIHPNFKAGSTHGGTIFEVFEYCLGFLPEAKVMRCHGLHVSSNIYLEAMRRGIEIDSSCFLGCHCPANMQFSFYGKQINEYPIYWMDQELLSRVISKSERGEELFDYKTLADHSFVYIFCFHPVYIYYNFHSLTIDWKEHLAVGGKPMTIQYGMRNFFYDFILPEMKRVFPCQDSPFLREIKEFYRA